MSDLWYGFYFHQDNSYYAFDPEILPKEYHNMHVGQTRQMWWEGHVWAAQCILISSKEEVDKLIEDLINGVQTLESLKLDEMDQKKKKTPAPKTPKRKQQSGNKRSVKRPKRNAEERDNDKENYLNNQDTDDSSNEETKNDEPTRDDNESKNENNGVGSSSSSNPIIPLNSVTEEVKNEETECSEEEDEPRDNSDPDTVVEMKNDKEDQKEEKEDVQKGECSGSGIATSSTVVKKEGGQVDKNVLTYRVAARQLTAAEDEYEEAKREYSATIKEGEERMYQARLYHQMCFSAMTKEQQARALEEK